MISIRQGSCRGLERSSNAQIECYVKWSLCNSSLNKLGRRYK